MIAPPRLGDEGITYHAVSPPTGLRVAHSALLHTVMKYYSYGYR